MLKPYDFWWRRVEQMCRRGMPPQAGWLCTRQPSVAMWTCAWPSSSSMPPSGPVPLMRTHPRNLPPDTSIVKWWICWVRIVWKWSCIYMCVYIHVDNIQWTNNTTLRSAFCHPSLSCPLLSPICLLVPPHLPLHTSPSHFSSPPLLLTFSSLLLLFEDVHPSCPSVCTTYS